MKQQVLQYLESLTSKELEEVFQNFVEYRENTILEEKVMQLEIQVEELQERLDCINYRDNYYE